MEGFNEYRLKEYKTALSWQLPLKQVNIEKIINGKSLGLRRIKYVPGSNSIFAEDIKGDLVPESIWFEKGVLFVQVNDLLKNEILDKHPWKDKLYELYSPAKEAKTKLQFLRGKDKVRKLIDESEPGKIQAIAAAIFGTVAFDWELDICELELRQYADKEPAKLEKELLGKDYEAKYIAALALAKRIVTTDTNSSKVIWNDTSRGEILPLAKGEAALYKLSEYLLTRTNESETLLQEITIRAKKFAVDVKNKGKDTKDMLVEAQASKIEELEKLLEKNSQEKELAEAREEYSKIFGKEVSMRFKNDLEYLNNKIRKK